MPRCRKYIVFSVVCMIAMGMDSLFGGQIDYGRAIGILASTQLAGNLNF